MLKRFYKIIAGLLICNLHIAAYQPSRQLPYDVWVTLYRKFAIAIALHNGKNIQITRNHVEVVDHSNLSPLEFIDVCIAIEEVASYAKSRQLKTGVFKRSKNGAITQNN